MNNQADGALDVPDSLDPEILATFRSTLDYKWAMEQFIQRYGIEFVTRNIEKLFNALLEVERQR